MMFPKPERRKLRRWIGQRDDPVTPERAAEILRRDRVCVAIVVGWDHECRDVNGIPHDYRETAKLSIEHVYVEGRGFGLRRPQSDRRHLVALCHGLNAKHAPAVLVERLRRYLEWINGLALRLDFPEPPASG